MYILRQVSVIIMVLIGARAFASCECADKSLKQCLEESNTVFVGEVVEARAQTIAEYKYYRAPGKRSWVSENAISPELKKIAESSISRDRVVWARFQDLRVIKGSFDGSQEIRMGDTIRSMSVTIGGLYLVLSKDGQTTSYCEGAAELSGWDDGVIMKLDELLNENGARGAGDRPPLR